MNEILIQARDVEELTQILSAVHTFFSARDIMQAQENLESVRPSPLGSEVERMHTKFRGYFSDFLYAQHLAEREDDLGDLDSLEEAPEASESLPGASEEVLPDAPLGKTKLPRQQGRRLTAEELGSDGEPG